MIANRSTAPVSYIQVQFEGLDANGSRVEQGMSNTTNLEPDKCNSPGLLLFHNSETGATLRCKSVSA